MSKRVVVVGAGIIGLCCAYYLRRDGHDVLVVDADKESRNGTSFGNAGMIVPSHFVPLAAPGVIEQGLRWMRDPMSPFYVKPRFAPEFLRWGLSFWRASSHARAERAAPLLLALNLASRDEYLRLASDIPGGFGLERNGLLMLCATEHGLAEESVVAARARSLGLDAAVLGRDELAVLEPDTTLHAVGAVHYRSDAHLDPGLFMQRLQRSLADDGVEFRWDTRIDALESRSGALTGVRSGSQVIAAEQLVLAAGAWSARLAAEAGARLLIEPGKGYSMTVEVGRTRLRTPAILSEARVAVSPLGDRLRVGGTMELSGFHEGDSEPRVKGIIGSALRYLPDLDRAALEAAPRWRGMRPCTPDGLPYLGPSRRYPNLMVATGHAMMGVSLAPITGSLVADLVGGRRPAIDIGQLDPHRHQRARARANGHRARDTNAA